MSVEKLDATNNTNGIYINNAADLSLVDLNEDGYAIQNNSKTEIISQQALIVESAIEQSADLLLKGDSFAISANITHQEGGKICFEATNDIIQHSGIIKTEQGQIDFNAGAIEQIDGHMVASEVIFKAINDVSIRSENNIIDTFSADVDTGSFSFVNANALSFNQIKAGGSVSLKSMNGSISGKDSNSLITASDLITLYSDSALTIENVITNKASINIDAQEDISIKNVVSANQIDIYNTTGDIKIGSISATDLNISAEQGSIIDLTDDNVLDITSENLNLSASAHISDLEVKVNNSIEAKSSTSGNISLYGVDTLYLKELSAADGSINIQAQGEIHAQHVSSNQDITLTSESGDLLIDSVSADNSVSLIAFAGSIKEVNDDQTEDILTDKLHLNAVYDISGLELSSNMTIQKATTDGNIILYGVENLNLKDVRTSDGLININAQGDILAQHVISNNDITLTSETGNLLIDLVNASNRVTLTSVSGSIKEINDDPTEDIITDKLHLSAVHDISGIDLSSDVTIEKAITDGNIDIQALGRLTIEKAITDGNIDIQTLGHLTIKESQTKTGAITIQAADTITAIHIDSKGPINIQNTEGDIIIDRIVSNDKITLNSNQGSIVEYGDDAEADIISTHVLLQAEKDIKHLELTDNTTLDAFSNSGTITIQGLNTLILNDIYASGIDIKTASDVLARKLISTEDSIKLYVSEGDITIGEIQSADDLILITNRGSILDDSDDNRVDITARDYINLLASYDVDFESGFLNF
jgi:hypothetical protein